MLSQGDELVRLTYMKWDPKFDLVHGTEKPYELRLDEPVDIPDSNFETELGPEEVIHDIRQQSLPFSLDDHAFAYRRDLLTITTWDVSTVKEQYFPSVKRLLRQEFGDNAEMKIFDWRIRSADETKTNIYLDKVVDFNDRTIPLRPAVTIHVDQSPAGARKRFMTHMEEQTRMYPGGRFLIVNVWRPLESPVEDRPLAVCDGSSIDDSLLIPVDYVLKSYVGESMRVLPSPKLRWYYLAHQTKDEVLLVKMYDSSPKVRAKCCPHTSFRPRVVPPDAKPRESIEVRVLVCCPPEEQ